MTELLSGVDAPSDAELISRVRGGDVAAYGELFARHVEAARRLGRQLVRGTDVDDLVSDAFAKVLHVLQDGGGPDVAFRAYLLTSVRRLHIDRIRAAAKVQPSEDMAQFDSGVPFQDPAVARFENGAAARAFTSLPERWQLVLWHLEVEGQKPADIAPLLGMTPNSVSALAYRAREGLRQAFLTMHLAESGGEDCRWAIEHLGAYVRKGLAKRDTMKVQNHLDECRRCTAMYLELTEVNSNLAGIIAPLLLGAAAAQYVSSGSAAGLTGVSAVFGRVRDLVTANAGGGAAAGAGSAAVTSGGLLTAGAIAAGVAAVTSAALVFGGSGTEDGLIEADQTVRVLQTPPTGGAAPEDIASTTEPAQAGIVEDDEVAADEPGPTRSAVASAEEPRGPDSADAVVPKGTDAAEPSGFSPAHGLHSGPAPGTSGPDLPGTGAGTRGPDTDPAPGAPHAGPDSGAEPGPGTQSPPTGDSATPASPDADGNPPSATPATPTPPLLVEPPDQPGAGSPPPGGTGAIGDPAPGVKIPKPPAGGAVNTPDGPGNSDGSPGGGNVKGPGNSDGAPGDGNANTSPDQPGGAPSTAPAKGGPADGAKPGGGK